MITNKFLAVSVCIAVVVSAAFGYYFFVYRYQQYQQKSKIELQTLVPKVSTFIMDNKQDLHTLFERSSGCENINSQKPECSIWNPSQSLFVKMRQQLPSDVSSIRFLRLTQIGPDLMIQGLDIKDGSLSGWSATEYSYLTDLITGKTLEPFEWDFGEVNGVTIKNFVFPYSENGQTLGGIDFVKEQEIFIKTEATLTHCKVFQSTLASSALPKIAVTAQYFFAFD